MKEKLIHKGLSATDLVEMAEALEDIYRSASRV